MIEINKIYNEDCLEGMRDSRGCNMEYGFAKAKGMPIKFITG